MSWEHRGIRGAGNPPSYLGSRAGKAVMIVGNARCVWDDILAYGNVRPDVMAVNDVGLYLDWQLNHWASLHANYLWTWIKLRKWHSAAIAHEFLSHSHDSHEGISIAWHLDNVQAFSGMFAIQVALALGYEKIILCGIPQDGSGRFFDPPWVNDGDHGNKSARDAFIQGASLNGEFKRCVRSMSGWTRELFGAP